MSRAGRLSVERNQRDPKTVSYFEKASSFCKFILDRFNSSRKTAAIACSIFGSIYGAYAAARMVFLSNYSYRSIRLASVPAASVWGGACGGVAGYLFGNLYPITVPISFYIKSQLGIKNVSQAQRYA
jgi:hypothetical protein